MPDLQTIEVPVRGMDCTACTQHVLRAISALPGVESVQVLLAAEKAVIRLDPIHVDLPAIRHAVEGAGYTVPAVAAQPGGIHSLEVPIKGMA
jgi:P-type Cu+ transporter